MKRVGISALVLLGTVLCLCSLSYAQPGFPGPDRMRHDGGMRQIDIEKKIQEAYERGFSRGFEQGIKTRRDHHPQHERPEFRGPKDERAAKGDFRPEQRGPRGDRAGKGGFYPKRPGPKWEDSRPEPAPDETNKSVL